MITETEWLAKPGRAACAEKWHKVAPCVPLHRRDRMECLIAHREVERAARATIEGREERRSASRLTHANAAEWLILLIGGDRGCVWPIVTDDGFRRCGALPVQVDHVFNDGAEHRRECGNGASNLALWVRDHLTNAEAKGTLQPLCRTHHAIKSRAERRKKAS